MPYFFGKYKNVQFTFLKFVNKIINQEIFERDVYPGL